MESNRLKILVFFLLLVLYGTLLAHKISLPFADDLGRHIKNGEMVLRGNFEVLHENFYSYTQTDYPVVNHHWLSGVIYYLILSAVGWGGLVIFKILLLLAAFAIVFKAATKKADFWLTTVLAIPAIIILWERTALRPENFSQLFFAIYLYLLVDLDENPQSKKIYWLLPLQLLWVNMHIFFIIGVALTGGFLVEKIILQTMNHRRLKENPLIKKMLILTALLIGVSFLNPNGAAGVFYPFYSSRAFDVAVSENLGLFETFRTRVFWSDYALALYTPIVGILALSFIFGFWKKLKPLGSAQDKPIFYLLASAAFAASGFLVVRSIAMFGLIFLPAAARNFNPVFLRIKSALETESPRLSEKVKKFSVACLMVILLGLTWFFGGKVFNPGIGLASGSMESAEFFQRQELRGPIFNNFDIGSYLIYNFSPREKVFVDNRSEGYSSQFFTKTYFPAIEDEDIWKQTLAKHQFNAIFFYLYDYGDFVPNFFWRRIRDPDWAMVYVDKYAIIFVRNVAENQKVIGQFAITSENAERRLAKLLRSADPDDQIAAADAFNLMGLDDLATQTFLGVVAKHPDRAKIWMILGQWELRKDDERSPILAAMFLDKAISLGWKTSEAYNYLGAAYYRLNRLENAKAALKESLKINPKRKDARDLLNLIEQKK
ncbi:MAG: tetratricopeptide repeat protein [Patescibacteria group bacterium]